MSTTPTPGDPAELDKIIASVDAVLDADPEGKKISATIRRETLKHALSKYGGKSYSYDPSKSAVDDSDIPWNDEEAYPDQVVRPTELVIPEAATEPYWYEKPEDAAFVEHFILSRVALGSRLPGGLLITGPSGSGKTVGVIKAVERLNASRPDLNLPLLVMDCATISDEQRWFGRREIDAAGSRYEKSDFVAAVENGAVILLDEWMRVHPRIHNGVMSLFAGTESALLSDLNLTITRHPRTVFIGTTNIGSQFAGTFRMDAAMRERWSFTIEREFPPEDEEIRILTSHNPGCDMDAAKVLVDIAEKSRQMFATGDLRSPISTRTLDNAAFLVASGYTEREALSRTAVPEYDGGADGTVGQESDRMKVLGILEGRSR
jgi:MoxR-like ATPase